MDAFRKLADLKTLLIDDNQLVRDTLTLAFRYKNCFIKAVSTAEAGLQALEKEHFDVIVCDFRLPSLNGVAFFKQAIRSHPHTIRVLISGYGNEETIAAGFDAGVHEFIKKPFSLSVFVDRLIPHVDRYLAEKRDRPDAVEKKTAFKCSKTGPPGVKEKLSSYRLKSDGKQMSAEC